MQQPNQQPLYRVTGQLPRGFQGHIAYTTLLPEDLRALRIVFTFDKREPQQDLEALHRDCLAAVVKNGVPVERESSGPLAQRLCAMPKGEINFSVFLNGACVGSAHRNQLEKRVILAADGSSEGFVSCRPAGSVRVVLHVLNVLNDDTNYSLCLEGVYE